LHVQQPTVNPFFIYFEDLRALFALDAALSCAQALLRATLHLVKNCANSWKFLAFYISSLWSKKLTDNPSASRNNIISVPVAP
jgi:hypothetical protein